LVLLLLPAHGSAQGNLSAGSFRLRFGGELGQAHHIQLCGSSDTRTLRFYSEPRWRPASGSRLHLFLEHSPNLDGDRSFLSVSLNYGILRSLRLDEQNERRVEVSIPLPAESIARENELVFAVTQFSREPAGGAPCTSVKLDSYIELAYSEGEPAPDLSQFPAPFVDPRSYRPQKVSLLVPDETAATPTLQAMALMAANLVRQARPQPLQFTLVRTIAAADDPFIIVGTPQEQPQLAGLQAGSRLVIQPREGKRSITFDKDTLGESEGLAGVTTALQSGGRRVPVLFLTANSPTGVLSATQEILSRRINLTGTVARIAQTSPAQPTARREWAGFIPPRSRFKLSDLAGPQSRSGAALSQAGLLRLDAPPDARFLDYGHQLNLAIGLARGENPLPWLTVRFNDELIGRLAAQEVFRGSAGSAVVEVPARLLRTSNVLMLGWEGATQKNAGPEITLLPSSEFYLPRVYRTELPDLSLLQHHLYPFSLQPSLEDLAVLIPDRISVDTVALLTEIAGVIGRSVPADFLNFQVRRSREATRSELAGFNLIVLIPEIGTSLAERILGRWQPLPWIEGLKAFPRIQQQASPWNSSKWVLVIESSSVPALQEAVRLCFSDRMLRQLRRDSAVLAGARPVSFSVVQTKVFQERLYLMMLEAWMREHWVALPIVLALASALLFWGLRVVLVNYRRAQDSRSSVRNAT
jgi:Bacterial cellulose synthase subunit